MSNNPFIPNGATSIPDPGTSVPGIPTPGGPTTGITDSFEVDLSNVEESSAYVIPDGLYKAKCVDIAQDVSKSGNPMFVWQFEIMDNGFAGRIFKLWTAITPAAMWKVAETVIALGVGQSGQVVKFKRTDVLNKMCGLVMEQDEYNGKPISRIDRVISLQELTEQRN